MESQVYGHLYEIEESLWWYRGRRKVCFDLLDRFLGPGDDRDILDVGCGTGYNLTFLSKYGRASGVDMSVDALHFCRERGVENVKLHEAEELPYQDQSFDLLTAFDVIEHIEDDRAALQEFERLLRPGGWMLIYTPALPWLYNEHDRRVHHKRRYVRKELESKIRGAGFEIQHISYVNLFILPIVVLARLVYTMSSQEHPEMNVPPEPFNWFFSRLCAFESFFVNSITLPYGMSLVALARKRKG
jgi:ubiquinone/menaquinone biosynthesis C-methylase UbiE